ncbi:hypothetical protein SAMN04489859_1008118 [Paracoccus alcaliphilus]|uniref:Uncharacterized protein n=1 Tax=Paracoccus alcaliphilus TaxID=34002 RepID=A0A1H8H458_9RHOB|nr:hypothetical protein [Paracoccus alcaliphilus]WCR17375.1 hypothetical protein JHW40_13640 [Paracoccus alcaliphilus]SEN51181.1 hypothetical protein SAMN04489859_1008118 [Paracoccus alcaliphilus]
MTDAPAPEMIPVEPSQPGPTALEGQMNIPEPETPEEQPEAKAEPVEAEKPKKSLDDSLKEAFKKGREAAERKAEAKAEKVEAKPAEEQPAEDKPAEPIAKDNPQTKPTAFREPPQRFDDSAKGEWEAVPESVRGNVHRMQRELETGIEKYRQQVAEYEEVRQYADMAKQSGTTLKAALDSYVGLEQALRQNPIAGLEQIVSNMGLKGPNGQPLTFRAIAAHVVGQPQDKVTSQQDATIMQLRQQVQALTQQLGGVQQHFQRQEVQQREAAASSEWESFARENPRAEELQEEIADTLKKYPASDNITIRERLADAYAIVIARNPAPSAAHTGTDTLAQTQTPEPRQPKPEGRKSISGSPSAGTLTPSGKKKSPPSIDEALANAVRRAS